MSSPLRLSSTVMIQGIGTAAFCSPAEPVRLFRAETIDRVEQTLERFRDAEWTTWWAVSGA